MTAGRKAARRAAQQAAQQGGGQGVKTAAGAGFFNRLGGLAKVGGPILGTGLAALPILMEGYDDYTKEGESTIDNAAAGTTALGVGALGAGAGALIGGGIGSLFGPVGTGIGASIGAGLAGGPAADVGGNIGRGANDLLRSLGVLPKEPTELDKKLAAMNKMNNAQLKARLNAIPVTRRELEMMNEIGAEAKRNEMRNHQLLAAQGALLSAGASPGQTWDPSSFAAALSGIGMG